MSSIVKYTWWTDHKTGWQTDYGIVVELLNSYGKSVQRGIDAHRVKVVMNKSSTFKEIWIEDIEHVEGT